jgi:hypothetical protein
MCKNKVYSLFGFKVRLKWKQTHHGYYGIILMLGGFLHPILFVLGAYIASDDIWQHHKQVKEYNPCYHSPLHNLYGKYLYKFWIVRKLNEFADWLFANPILVAIIVCLIVIWRLL